MRSTACVQNKPGLAPEQHLVKRRNRCKRQLAAVTTAETAAAICCTCAKGTADAAVWACAHASGTFTAQFELLSSQTRATACRVRHCMGPPAECVCRTGSCCAQRDCSLAGKCSKDHQQTSAPCAISAAESCSCSIPLQRWLAVAAKLRRAAHNRRSADFVQLRCRIAAHAKSRSCNICGGMSTEWQKNWPRLRRAQVAATLRGQSVYCNAAASRAMQTSSEEACD